MHKAELLLAAGESLICTKCKKKMGHMDTAFIIIHSSGLVQETLCSAHSSKEEENVQL